VGTFEIAQRMTHLHDRTALDMVVTAGDNIYPNGAAEYLKPYFERPFEGLIKRNVPFYAALGNHDVRSGYEAQMRYPLFNMGGHNYYTVAAGTGTVEFFILDTNDFDRRQLAWLDGELSRSAAIWKVPVFHHPTYSAAKKHGSNLGLRRMLEPVFVRHGVKAAISGHDHVYQRTHPQSGVTYFISGAGGEVRVGDLKRSDPMVAAGYDDTCHFMLIEADATTFRFRAVNNRGRVVDEGQIAAERTPLARRLSRFAAV
jgi:3',5'-cyclic AMP phosphodiesterase CpdA